MSDNILVAVRVRPLITREVSDSSNLHWQTGSDNTLTQVDPQSQKALSTPYKFDRVYGSDYNNLDVYLEVAEPIVESALAGFNGTIFAYGQTSSGKTYTMMGTRDCPGIIPMTIQNIFSTIENTPDREYLIRVSYMEIYNENITDLLAPRETRGKGLSVREDISGSVYVADLKEECVNCEENLIALMRKGDKNRHVGVTNMNERSSRSHTIFRLILESRERTEGDCSDEAVVVSQLNLVDLAGSENASQTGATGERLKEGGFINRSLFMLGRVISQLSDGDQFVNFRDSKLTRILQPSLGGNAKTAIICTVTPAAVEQTHSTLRFASRAKSIKNKPVLNEVVSDSALLKRYAKEIKVLKQSLEKERNTDKAQEVEQVREMLDEQARKNEDLQAKVNELKAKLVVSSLPRQANKPIPEKKKARRETWAAPAARRAMRMSMAPLKIEPLNLKHEFIRPELPPWKDLGRLSEESETSVQNVSCMSDGFGKDDLSFSMDLAEQSKLGKLENSFSSPEIIGRKHKRRVQFDFSVHNNFIDAECQTDESLLPKINLLNSPCLSTPKRSSVFASPGTPAHVLRSRNADLKQKLEDQTEWLDDWQTEIRDLRDFHRNELQLLEDSFNRKIADGPIDITKLETKEEEISSLKHSLNDAETLLMDANRELSQKTQEIALLQEELQIIKEENKRTCGFEDELSKLKEENKQLKNSLNEKERSINQFEKDKQDFDMVMELALEKQRGKENDLRKSLEAAWEEIASHENGNVDTVRRRSMQVSEMEKELTLLRKNEAEFYELKANNAELQSQLEATVHKQQAAEQAVEEQNMKIQEMLILVEKLKELEEQVSRIEELESELVMAKNEIDSKEKKNQHLQETANALQMQLEERESSGTPARVRELEEELEYLREKLDEGSTGGSSFLAPKPLQLLNVTQDSALMSVEISRKLSETLQVLEESVLLPSTPNRGSVSSLDEPCFQMHDFNFIKQQLLALQEALLIQEQQQQKFEEVKEEVMHKHEYHSHIVAEVESQISLWNMVEALCADYIIHSQNPFIWSVSQVSPQSPPIHVDTEQAVQKAVEEIKLQIQADFDAKLEEERADFEARLIKESKMRNESFQVPSSIPVAPLSLADELKDAGMNMTICNETFETSILNLETDSLQEVQRLKQQLDLLNKENSALLEQVKQLSQDEEKVATVSAPLLKSSAPQSLADELQQAGMHMGDDTFETSILNLVTDSSSQELIQLKHQLELLHQENSHLNEQIKQLQHKILKSQEEKERVEIKMQDTLKEKEALESHIKSLEEQLSDNQISVEEMFSLRWEIDSLKQEKSEIEDELKLMQDEGKAEKKLSDNQKEADSEKETYTESPTTQELKCQEGEDENASDEDMFAEEDIEIKNVEKLDDELAQLREKLNDKIMELKEAEKKVLSIEDNYRLESGELADIKGILASNQQLKEMLDERNMEIDNLNKKIKDLQLKELDDEFLEKLKEEFDIAKQKIVKLEEDAQKQHIEFEEKISQVIADKDSELEMFITNFSDKEEALEEKVKELESANSDVGDIRKSLVSKELEVQNLTTECNSLRAVVSDLEKQLMEEQNKCADAESKFEALQKEKLDGSIEIENRIQELKKIIANYEEDLHVKSTEVEEIKKSFDHQKELLDTAEREKQELKELNERKIMEESISESIKTETEKTLDTMTSVNDKLDELKELEEEYASKVREYKQLQDCADNLRMVLSKKEKELETLSSEHAQEVSSYIEDLNVKDEKIQELEEVIKQKKEVHVNMTTALDAKDHKLKRLTSELLDAQHSLENKEKELQCYLESAESGLSAQLKELQAEVEYLNKLQSEVCEDRKKMMEAIKEKEDIVNNLLSDQSALKKELEIVTDELNVAKEKMRSYEEEVNEKDGIISELKSDLSSQKSEDQLSRDQEIEKMVGIIEKYETEISEKQLQLETVSKEVLIKDEKIGEIEKNLEDLQKQNEDMAEELIELKHVKERCSELEKELANTKEKLTGEGTLHDSISCLENKLAEYKQKAEQYEDEISCHLSEKEELTKKLSQTEDKLNDIKREFTEMHEKLDAAAKALEEQTQVAKCRENQLNCQVENLEEDLNTVSTCLTVKEEELDKQKEAFAVLEKAKQKLEEQLLEKQDQSKDLYDQLESNNTQIEKLVRIIEKYEHEMSEKDMQLQTEQEKYETNKSEKEDQIQNLLTEMENKDASIKEAEEAIHSLQVKNQTMLDKLLELEGVKDKCSKLENELIEQKKLQATLEDFPEKLRNTEKNLAILKSDYEEDVKKYKEEISQYMSQHEEILSKLSQTESELQNFKELVQVLQNELQEKEETIENKEGICEQYNTEKDKLVKQLEKAAMEIKHYKEEIAMYESQDHSSSKKDASPHHELSAKLRRTTEELHYYKEKLESLQKEVEEKEKAMKEKELECTKLDAEMDDIVQHFEKEGQWKTETIANLNDQLSKVESELKETKQKLTDSVLVCNQTTNSGDAISELQNQIQELKEELKTKVEECDRLNAEMDEIVDHYKKEGTSYANLYNELDAKLKRTENELCLTKSKLAEVSRQESSLSGEDSSPIVQCLRDQIQEQGKEVEILMKGKETLEKEIDILLTQNKKLEHITEKMRNQIEEGEQARASLEEELKVSSDTVDSLLERLGDMDKFKLVYDEEKAALETQLQECQQRIEMLMTSSSDRKDGMEQLALMEKVKDLESDLQRSNKNFEEVADEVNRWKQEYTRQFEECEDLKARIVKGEMLLKEQKENYEQEMAQLSTQLNTLVNSSTMSTPGLNMTGKKKNRKASDLEQQRNDYILLCAEREKKIKELEEQLESFRRSQGVVSTVEEFQREMKWMREKMESAEQECKLLNKNFDILEKDYEKLQRENEELENNVDSTEEIENLKRKIKELSEENSFKHDSGVTSKDSSTSEEGSLRDRLVVLERENNELRFRLRALNAPAEKEVQSLREEISLANQKVTHLKAELRRLQNSKKLDSTICEMKGSSHHSEDPRVDQLEGGSFDYSSGSGIVMEVQVLHLKNMVYHLEKDKKRLQNECKIMEQHVDHYKKKAQEWKDTATKEKKIGEKMAKELETKRSEIKHYQTAIEENRGFTERQKFEMGQQREMIEKLEKEKQEHLQKMQADATAVPNSMRRQTMLASMKESSLEFSKGATNIEEGKPRSVSLAPTSAGTQLHLSNHNAPLPSQTRIERLPGAKGSSSDVQKMEGKVPMWQSLNKENKDYSKYYLQNSSKKKQEEDCKQQ